MASIAEKAPVPSPRLHLNTPVVAQKPSQETMSDTLTPTQEKNGTTSMEMPRSSDVSSPRSNHLNPFDTDIEAMITPITTTGNCSRTTISKKGGTDCQVWPGREHWKQKAKLAKKKRTCSCLSHLSKRNRLIAKILIVVLIVGIAVGVGFGISKPLGAGIWKSPS